MSSEDITIWLQESLVRGLPSVGFLDRFTICTTHSMEGSTFFTLNHVALIELSCYCLVVH